MFFTGELMNKTSVPDFEFSPNSVCELGNSSGGNLDCDSILIPVLDTTTVPVTQQTSQTSTVATTTAPMTTSTTTTGCFLRMSDLLGKIQEVQMNYGKKIILGRNRVF